MHITGYAIYSKLIKLSSADFVAYQLLKEPITLIDGFNLID